MKFESSDISFLLALASVIFSAMAFGFAVCNLFSNYIGA